MRTREEPQNARIRQMAAPRLPVIRMALAEAEALAEFERCLREGQG